MCLYLSFLKCWKKKAQPLIIEERSWLAQGPVISWTWTWSQNNMKQKRRKCTFLILYWSSKSIEEVGIKNFSLALLDTFGKISLVALIWSPYSCNLPFLVSTQWTKFCSWFTALRGSLAFFFQSLFSVSTEQCSNWGISGHNWAFLQWVLILMLF